MGTLPGRRNGGCGVIMKKYENLIKVFCVLGFATLFIGYFILFVFPLPTTQKFINLYLGTMYGIFCFFGIGLIVLLIISPKEAVLGVMRGKKTDEPYKAHAEYADFDELKDTIVANLKRKKYKLYELDNEYLRNKLFIYYKHIWFDQKFFILAYPGELDDEEFLTEVSCTVSSILREISPFSRSHLYVTSMHCVNTESDAFFSHLKEVYVFNPICEYEIRAGYAIDSQTLYIGAPYFGDLGNGPVIILRRKLLKMLGIPRKNLKK